MWYDKAERKSSMPKEKKNPEEVAERKKAYDNKYRQENYRNLPLRVSKKYEADVLEKLDRVDNIRQYVIRLIREDIAREKEDTE